MRRSMRLLATAAMAVGVVGAGASAASAAGPTGDFAVFNHCPYTNPAVQGCVYSVTNSGSFKLGNATVPITSSTPITLQGGVGDLSGDLQPIIPAVGADTLSRTPLQVPGGLIGLVDTGGWSGALISLFNAAVASVNNVTATAELVGSAQIGTNNFVGQTGTAVKLPVRIHLQNPFLGPNCYIGTTSRPAVLNLTTGTTAPAAPNRPITGSPGSLSYNDDFTVVTISGSQLVDNAFSAPAANDCGFLLLDKLLITAGVNLREGLPAAAGKNTAILGGNTKEAGSFYVADSVQ
jgi:hypothetical protein